MGVGVSNWQLARAVSMEGQLGVVSGTLIDTVFARRLQDGDPGGHMHRACESFPEASVVESVWKRYYRAGGKAGSESYKQVPMLGLRPSVASLELLVLANFAEVFLAKEGHDGMVGINYLEKVQLPHLPSIYGAMLAGVDYIFMGAGIPKYIPGILDDLCQNKEVRMKLDVQTDPGCRTQEPTWVTFNPADVICDLKPLKRPRFIAIVSSHTLATNLARKSSGKVNGFVIENHRAGGHNAPPRGPLTLSPNGEPVYGERDDADICELKKTGLPFWLAGMFGSHKKLCEALEAGAAGVQVGTPFAFCRESGIAREIKDNTLKRVLDGTAGVFTDPDASASGYPFKVLELEGTLSQANVYESRTRVCDLGYLRSAYSTSDGSIGFRCPGEPECEYVRKGGRMEDTVGRKCLCNALLSTIGLEQVRKSGYVEPPIVTAGDHVTELKQFLGNGKTDYSARSVVDCILGRESYSETSRISQLDEPPKLVSK